MPYAAITAILRQLMKLLINILFLVITAAYTLPVKELLSKESVTCVYDMEDSKVDESKKEKAKEIVCVYNMDSAFINPLANPAQQAHIDKTQLLHQVETPPPDFI